VVLQSLGEEGEGEREGGGQQRGIGEGAARVRGEN
jgi:hypothetical protein